MPTLGDLKTRVIAETNRDDLGQGEALEATLASCIARAIEHFSGEEYWFAHANAAVATSAGVATMPLPAEVRIAQAVAHNGALLGKVPFTAIAHAIEQGLPTRWAADGERLRLWPIPDAAYALDIFGLAQIDAPAGDAETSVWTNEAYDLIAARTRFLLFRDVFRDVEGTQLAAQAEGEALSKLRSETRRRSSSPLRSTGDEPWAARASFNSNTGS
jgi:hypothetical protein